MQQKHYTSGPHVCSTLCGAATLAQHENHERFDHDCALCQDEMDESARIAGRPATSYSKAELDEARQIRPEMRR